MKHAYIPRTTTYNLNPGEELNDLRMSDEVRPLYEHVKKFIRETVDPMSVEFVRLGEDKTDRWSFTPDQLEVLQKAKDKAKEVGLWNFFLPDAETGQGLKNLDYAYIAVELGKNPLASESLNCSAPDTGNMEVLERVGTPEQKEKWLKPLLAGEIRSAYAMTEPDVASSDAKNIATTRRARRRRVGDQRREVLHLRRRRSALQDHDRDGEDQSRRAAAASSSRRSWCRSTRPASRSSGPMHVFGHDDAPHGHMHLRFNNVPGAEGEHAARRRPRLRDLAGPPRTGPHPSLHAHDRQGREGARPDGARAASPARPSARRSPISAATCRSSRRRACEIEAMRLMVLKAAKAMDVLGNKEARSGSAW